MKAENNPSLSIGVVHAIVRVAAHEPNGAAPGRLRLAGCRYRGAKIFGGNT